MATRIVSFQSALTGTLDAVKDGLASAQPSLFGRTPQFGVIFASHHHSLDVILAGARGILPETEFVAAWGIQGFTERAATGCGLVGMLFSSDEMMHSMTFSPRIGTDAASAAAALVNGFGDSERTARHQRLAKSTTLMFVDGLSGLREQVIDLVRKGTRPYQAIVGSATTDNGTFSFCKLGTTKGGVMRDAAAAVHVFSSKNWSIGVDHGHTPTTSGMIATKAEGVILHEIDGRPALDVYRAHAAERGASLTSEESLRVYMIQYPIGVMFYEDLSRIRTPFAALPNGALVCGGVVPEGSKIRILSASRAQLVQAASTAAEAAKFGLDGEAAGVLVFSCFGRNQTLSPRQVDEIEAVRKVFPATPILGASSYGEIARYGGALDGFHNNTVVVVAVPA